MPMIRGQGIGYDVNPLYNVQSGITPPSQIGVFNTFDLAAGASYLPAAGWYGVKTGGYTWVQDLDPVSGRWKTVTQTANVYREFYFDGTNRRLVNLTGCAVGAIVTTAGSGYTDTKVGSTGSLDTSTSPTVTVTGGASLWKAIVGGGVSGTVTKTVSGAGYNYAPTLLVAAPPPGGVQCTMVTTVSAGAIGTITVTNQGAGYQTAPSVVVVPDPRDTPTTNAVLTTALTGTGTVTAVQPTNHGTPVTAIPTLAFSSGSAAATVIMAWTCTAITFSNAGVAYGNAQPYLCTIAGGITAATGASGDLNPDLSLKLFVPRTGFATGTSDAGGTLIVAPIIDDGGLFQRVPNVFITASGTAALPTTTAIAAATVGGVTDTVSLQLTGGS